MNENRTVAVFLNVFFNEDNDAIGWYDHDYSEGWSISSIDDLRGGSYSKSHEDKIIEAAQAMGITEFGYIFKLFQFEYEGEPGPLPEEMQNAEGVSVYGKPYFLGNFTYSR